MPIIKMARVIRESEQLYKKKGMDVKNYEKRRTANTVACLGPRIGWMLARAHILRFTSIVSRFVRLLSKYLPESSRQQDKECQETFESLASYLRQKCTLLLSEGEERWEGGGQKCANDSVKCTDAVLIRLASRASTVALMSTLGFFSDKIASICRTRLPLSLSLSCARH